MNETYKTTNQSNAVTRNSSLKLFQTRRTKALSQKYLLYLGSFILNDLPDDVKLSNNVSTFKHKVRTNFLTLLREKDQYIYVFLHTMDKLTQSLPHFNHGTIIRTRI